MRQPVEPTWHDIGVDHLAPLRYRYAQWLALNSDGVLADREEAAEDIRALQLILRLERSGSPSWHAALGLAAQATAQLCLDPRATEASGEWRAAIETYCQGHIRKVTRRARASQWEAVQDLPGITLRHGDTEVRALLPGLVAELDKRVSKLQVGGTDLPPDDPIPVPESTTGPLLRMWLPPEPAMTLGKSMAQAGHAAMIAAALLAGDRETVPELDQWLAAGCPAVGARDDGPGWARRSAVLARPEQAWRQDRLLAVRDAGFTEIAPGTITVIAQIR